VQDSDIPPLPELEPIPSDWKEESAATRTLLEKTQPEGLYRGVWAQVEADWEDIKDVITEHKFHTSLSASDIASGSALLKVSFATDTCRPAHVLLEYAEQQGGKRLPWKSIRIPYTGQSGPFDSVEVPCKDLSANTRYVFRANCVESDGTESPYSPMLELVTSSPE
jgi:hypothetical protein